MKWTFSAPDANRFLLLKVTIVGGMATPAWP
jgi:hypothetical protein